MMLNREYLESLAKLAATATPGECFVAREDQGDGSIKWELWIGDDGDGTYLVHVYHDDWCPPSVRKDMELFAASREAVPAMAKALLRVMDVCAELRHTEEKERRAYCTNTAHGIWLARQRIVQALTGEGAGDE